MAEKNYYLRQGELGAVMGPKTMVDERGPAWSRLYSIKLNQPLGESPHVLFNFRSIQNATLFLAFTETGHGTIARAPQDPESSPAEAIMLFWNNLMKDVPTLPEEPQGDRIFKLPLTNGTWVLLDMTSVQRSIRNPEILLMYWSTDGESTLQTQQKAHAVFGKPQVAMEDLTTKQIKDLVDDFVASNHFPKGKVISPMVARVEETEEGSVIIAYMSTTPKKEYEVEITTPTGEKYKGILVVDPTLAP